MWLADVSIAANHDCQIRLAFNMLDALASFLKTYPLLRDIGIVGVIVWGLYKAYRSVSRASQESLDTELAGERRKLAEERARHDKLKSETAALRQKADEVQAETERILRLNPAAALARYQAEVDQGNHETAARALHDWHESERGAIAKAARALAGRRLAICKANNLTLDQKPAIEQLKAVAALLENETISARIEQRHA
jgi:hypothetical protein